MKYVIYKIPSDDTIAKCTIDDKVVRGEKEPIIEKRTGKVTRVKEEKKSISKFA